MSYRMTLETLQYLTSNSGKNLLRQIEDRYPHLREKDILSAITYFKDDVRDPYLKGAIDLLLLRNKGKKKFDCAEKMYFTKESLQQASSALVARYRAKKYEKYDKVADLGCGIGADTVFISQVTEVIAFERDKLKLEMARLNVESCSYFNRVEFIHGDFMNNVKQNRIKECDAIFLDPSRRQNEEKVYSVFDYQPPLSFLKKLLEFTKNIGVKISPAFSYDEIKELNLDCSIEIISLNGECKEAVLWFGELKGDYERKATVLPGEESIKDSFNANIEIVEPQKYLYEPDVAVIRAHLVEDLAGQFDLKKISDDIAYLTGEKFIENDLIESWKIDEVIEFNLKGLNSILRKKDVGRVIMKKRGSPINVNKFRHRLKLGGKNQRVLFFTQVKGEPKVFLCFCE